MNLKFEYFISLMLLSPTIDSILLLSSIKIWKELSGLYFSMSEGEGFHFIYHAKTGLTYNLNNPTFFFPTLSFSFLNITSLHLNI